MNEDNWIIGVPDWMFRPPDNVVKALKENNKQIKSNTMPKYRKKPIIIEAIQLRWENWGDICDFIDVGKLSDGKPEGCYINSDTGEVLKDPHTSDEMGIMIPTPEGLMIGRQNDWIIKGINGEFYPCKPDIFEKTYELVI